MKTTEEFFEQDAPLSQLRQDVGVHIETFWSAPAEQREQLERVLLISIRQTFQLMIELGIDLKDLEP